MSEKREPTIGQQQARKRWAKRSLLALVVLGFVVAAVVAALPKPVPVETDLVSQGPLVVTVDEDGVARVKDRYIVSAPLSGNLARIELDPGDSVKQGDVLLRILPLEAPLLDARSRSQAEAQVARALAATKQADAQIERARAALDFSIKEAERTRRLFQEQTVSQAELDRALLEKRTRDAELTSSQFANKVAAHELRMARAALGRFDARGRESEQFEVPSPTGGRVLRVIQKSEGVVQAGAQLLEIGDPRALEIVVDVLTSDAVDIHASNPVTIEKWGGEPLSAAVRLVEPSAFTRISSLGVEEQRVNTVIDLSAPYEKWADLGDGYRVEARIQVHLAKRATRVPVSALFRSGKEWSVFVVISGVAKLRTVKLGLRNDEHAEALAGLVTGDRVILHPSDKVKDGEAVELR
jgi:HlyD family secretion protein